VQNLCQDNLPCSTLLRQLHNKDRSVREEVKWEVSNNLHFLANFIPCVSLLWCHGQKGRSFLHRRPSARGFGFTTAVPGTRTSAVATAAPLAIPFSITLLALAPFTVAAPTALAVPFFATVTGLGTTSLSAIPVSRPRSLFFALAVRGTANLIKQTQ